MRIFEKFSRLLPARLPLMLAVFLMPSVSQAALTAYMTMECDIQGTIMGDVTQAGREGQIEVYAFGHNISQARDAASGLPTGKRRHRPLRVLKPVDRSTPLIAQALFDNENCTEVTIRFWRPARSGKEIQFYTVTLTNASVVSVMPTMANNRVPENLQFPVWEAISFTYQTITLTQEIDNTSSQDSWETPVQ